MKESSYSIDYKKTRIDYFDEWIEQYQFEHGIDRLTYSEIALKLGIDDSTLNRKIHGKNEFTEKEVKFLSEFFNISCDEIITSAKMEYKTEVKNYGLNQKALECLEYMNRTEPKLIAMLEIILENERLADSLLRSFLIYIEMPILKLSSLIPYDSEEEIALNTTTGKEIIAGLLSSNYKILLEAVKHEWEKRISNHPKLRFKKKDIKIMEKKLTQEEARRIKTKMQTKHIRPKPIQEYWKTVDNLAKYKVFQLFMEKGLLKKEAREDTWNDNSVTSPPVPDQSL